MSKRLLAFLIPPFFFLIIILFFFFNQRKINEKIENFLEWGKAQISQLSKKEGEIEEMKKEISGLREEIIRMKNSTYSEQKETKASESKIEKESEIEEEKWCQKSGNQNQKREVIFNEICWMGDKDSSYNEWIELKNVSGKEIDLNGWQLKNKDEKIKIVLEGKIKKDGFFILERGEDALPEIESDFVFKGAIKNEDEALFLFDKDCNLEDEVFANPNWPAGDNLTKRTAERKKDFSWQTSQNPGGTPKAENSQGFVETKEKQPKINLNYPLEVFGQKEFEVSLSVSDLESKTYDIKISVESDSQIFSEIFDQSQNSWQSSNYYLKEYFTGSSFSGNFKLKIKTKNFIGDAKIFAKIRDSKNQKIVAQFEDRIKIKQIEEVQKETSEPAAPQTTFQASPLSVVINEIAWMGTTISYNNEWIELYNNNDFSINLDGWVLKSIDGTPTINLKGEIQGKDFYLLERTDDNTIPEIKANLIYTGSLENEGEYLQLLDNSGRLIDEINCSSGWFAGNNTTKQTMERINSFSSGNDPNNWATSTNPNGTPKAKNSVSQ